MKFGPADDREAYEFALEELRADTQYEIMKALKQAGLSQAALAKKMGVSPAWISQILGDDANLTFESVVKIFLALGSQFKVLAAPLGEHFSYAPEVRRAAVEDWKESIGEIRVRQSDTVATLMKVIEAGCRSKPAAVIVNDNSAQKNGRQLEAA